MLILDERFRCHESDSKLNRLHKYTTHNQNLALTWSWMTSYSLATALLMASVVIILCILLSFPCCVLEQEIKCKGDGHVGMGAHFRIYC